MSEILKTFEDYMIADRPTWWLVLVCGHWYHWTGEKAPTGVEIPCPDCARPIEVVPFSDKPAGEVVLPAAQKETDHEEKVVVREAQPRDSAHERSDSRPELAQELVKVAADAGTTEMGAVVLPVAPPPQQETSDAKCAGVDTLRCGRVVDVPVHGVSKEIVSRQLPDYRFSVAANGVEVDYKPQRGWFSRQLGYHDGIGPYFSLPEALKRAEVAVGESAWQPYIITAEILPPPAPEPEKLRELLERLDRERFTVVQWQDEAEPIFERREHLGAWVPWTAIENIVRALIAAAGSLPPREDKNQ